MTLKEAFLALNLLPGIGPIRARRLLEAFPQPQDVINASEKDLQQIPGIGREMARSIHGWENLICLLYTSPSPRDRG